MFDEAIQLMDQYREKHSDILDEQFQGYLIEEVKNRLRQMDWLITQVQERENTNNKIHHARLKTLEQAVEKGSSPSDALISHGNEGISEQLQANFESRILAEAFYYQGGRVRSLLRNKYNNLGNISSFECEGVRNVRNHLLEHPEGKASRVFDQSGVSGGQNGPIIKALRDDAQQDVFPDKGLFYNAEEFGINLQNAIRKGL